MTEAILAFLAAAGVSALVWVLADAVLYRRKKTIHASILLPLSGGAEDLEISAASARRALHRLHSDGEVLLVDCGLEEESLRRAGLLARDLSGVKLVCPEELEQEVF